MKRKIKLRKKMANAVTVKQLENQERNKMEAIRKAFDIDDAEKASFFTWDKFEEMFTETAKVLYVHGKTVSNMLKDEAIAESLRKSPGAPKLINSFGELVLNLTSELKKIHVLHDGKSGEIEVGSSDMDVVFEIFEKYNGLRETIEGEYAQCMQALKELQDAPAAFLAPEELDYIAEVRENYLNGNAPTEEEVENVTE